MILYRLPILILLMSFIYIFVIPEEPAKFKFAFQFIPMILILLHAYRLVPKNKSKTHHLLLIGLITSFVGHATSSWFIVSIIIFSIVQICYTVGFHLTKEKRKLPLIPIISLIVIYISICSIFFSRALIHAEQEDLMFPVLLYIVLLAMTFWSATSTNNGFAISGSLLFIFAHTLTFWHLFIQPMSYAEPIVILSYFAAQFFIATSLDNVVRGAKSIVW